MTLGASEVRMLAAAAAPSPGGDRTVKRQGDGPLTQ